MKIFNRAIRILLVTNALILVAAAMLGPIYALFVEEIGGDLLDAGFTFGTFALVAGITSLITGRYADRVKDNELIVALGYSITGLGFFGYTLVNSMGTLLAAQVVIGLGGAVSSPAFDAVYSKHIDGHTSGSAWGAWEAINYFTLALGAISGGFLVTLFGFDTLFVAMGLLCFLSASYIVYLPRKVL